MITHSSAVMGNCENKGFKKTLKSGMWFSNNALFDKSNLVLLCGEESVLVGTGVSCGVVWFVRCCCCFFGGVGG